MTGSTLAAVGGWTKTGDLPAAASWYGQHENAVLLNDGRVLVAGGADGASVPSNRAALYDPKTTQWAATATTMQVARRGHTLTLLGDGTVLAAGGTSGSAPLSPGLPSAEIYDPGDGGGWSPAPGMLEGRWGHSAVRLADGKVLVAGGYTPRTADSVTALRSAELYDPGTGDPGTGAWAAAKPMTDARSGHAAVRLQAGQVLVCGGTAPISGTGEAALAFCELYQTNGKWAATGSLTEPRSRHQALLVSDTTVLVIGGSTPGTPGDGRFDPFTELGAELFDQATGAWTRQEAGPGGRGFHRAVPLGSGKILVVGGTAGGANDAGYQSALIYDSAAKEWSTAAGLATGRWAFAATALSEGQVLVTGGAVRSGLAAADPATVELTATTEVFSLAVVP
jgi:N-acetylneuraminic acid mutarotase